MPHDPVALGAAHGFHPVRNGNFQLLYGPAHDTDQPRCDIKLCFTAVDLPLLVSVLVELAAQPDCWAVKFGTRDRDGMYLGRCFFSNQAAVGRTWARYKLHPRLFCSVQDDTLTAEWRPNVARWPAEQAPAS